MIYDALVIGGGFFGCNLALALREKGYTRVALVEREADLLLRASTNNQARVHNGYHYPRSMLTGLRSKENYDVFCSKYSDCIFDNFKGYYAISKFGSTISAKQFEHFCGRIGAPLRPADKSIKAEFSKRFIDALYEVDEVVFDSSKLRMRVQEELLEAQISLYLNCIVERVCKNAAGEGMRIFTSSPASEDKTEINAGRVFVCTYSGTNSLLSKSGLPQIPLQQELAEVCIIKPVGFLEKSGVTVMCGPFFSILPHPPSGLHTLTHVRYTPHFSWVENDSMGVPPLINHGIHKSKFLYMKKDAMRYLPIVDKCVHVDSIWENKTLLPLADVNDSRPILFKTNHGIDNLTCVIGAKIDNVFEMRGLIAEK